jgi:hypothetical protein
LAVKRSKIDQLDRRDIFRKCTGACSKSNLQLCNRTDFGGSQLQLIQEISEQERKHPGFSFALKFCKQDHKPEIETFCREHIKLLLDDQPEISNFFELVDICFRSARNGARVLITDTDEEAFVEFSAGVTIAAEQFGATLDRVERAIAVDGHIESVYEIDKLLTQALDSHQSLILCRSISKEVQLTVQQNCDRMKLAIITFKITDETVNDLGDACAALGIPLYDSFSTTELSWQHKQFQDVSKREANVAFNRLFVNAPSSQIEMRKNNAARKTFDSSATHTAELFERRLVNLGGVVRVNIKTGVMSKLCVDALTRSMLVLDDAARHGIVKLNERAVSVGAYCAAAGFFESV